MSGAQQTAWKKLETLGDGEGETVINQLRQAVTEFKGLPEIEPPKGLIAELAPAFKAGKAASERAERVARVNIDECVVGVGGPHIRGLRRSQGDTLVNRAQPGIRRHQ